MAPIHKFLGGGGKICYDVGTEFLLHRHAKRFVSASNIEVNNIHALKGTKGWHACT